MLFSFLLLPVPPPAAHCAPPRHTERTIERCQHLLRAVTALAACIERRQEPARYPLEITRP